MNCSICGKLCKIRLPKKARYYVITHQLLHDSHLALTIVGPDTALHNYQIARNIKDWAEADRIKQLLADNLMSPAYFGTHYEVHQKRRDVYKVPDGFEGG